MGSTFTGSVSGTRFTHGATGQHPAGIVVGRIGAPDEACWVYLKGLEVTGSGFFVTETGLLATNAHVARGGSSFLAVLSGGPQLRAKVVYIDADLDFALAKVEAPSSGFIFPHLSLADATSVQQGESVLAIGNPGDAMLFSVTKGIVSAVGNSLRLDRAHGSRPTRRSIPVIRADRW